MISGVFLKDLLWRVYIPWYEPFKREFSEVGKIGEFVRWCGGGWEERRVKGEWNEEETI